MAQKTPVTKGLVLGKFMPPHAGHLHLVRTAMTAVDQLTVMVCSIKAEPIPGYLRFGWMKSIFPEASIRVIHVTDENPQAPEDHPNFWSIWLETIDRNCPEGIDYVFTSEEYGETLAKRLCAQHILVDLDRETFPVSGTKVRNDPFGHWDYISEVVRPYFLKRIVLVGPESTGKSTLAKRLAEHFDTICLEEYGREYTDKFGMDLSLEDISNIAAGHLFREEKAALQANRLLICDTDLIVTQIWSEIYFQTCPEWILQVNHSRKYDLYLLMDIDIPWDDDGTREFPHLREFHFRRLKEELVSRNLPFEVISGDYEERFLRAVEIIEEKFKPKD